MQAVAINQERCFIIILMLQWISLWSLVYAIFSGFRPNSSAPAASEDLRRKYQNLLESSLSATNYKERFKFLLQSEEHQMNIDIRSYDMEVIIHIGSKYIRNVPS